MVSTQHIAATTPHDIEKPTLLLAHTRHSCSMQKFPKSSWRVSVVAHGLSHILCRYKHKNHKTYKNVFEKLVLVYKCVLFAWKSLNLLIFLNFFLFLIAPFRLGWRLHKSIFGRLLNARPPLAINIHAYICTMFYLLAFTYSCKHICTKCLCSYIHTYAFMCASLWEYFQKWLIIIIVDCFSNDLCPSI